MWSEDTETLHIVVDMPQVDAQVIGGNERRRVTVQRYRVDMVAMGVGEYSSGDGLNGRFNRSEVRDANCRYRLGIPEQTRVSYSVEPHCTF